MIIMNVVQFEKPVLYPRITGLLDLAGYNAHDLCGAFVCVNQ